MAFDAGAIMAHLDIDLTKFDKKLSAEEARVDAFTRKNHVIRISAVFDNASLSKARKAFADLDNMISRDAAQRLKSSPQGSVLGALNALFSPHPVSGSPSPQQSAQNGLLGKMLSQSGGGGSSGIAGTADQRTTSAGNVASTNNQNTRVSGGGASNANTTDLIRQILTGQGAVDAKTTDTIRQVLTGQGATDKNTTDSIKQVLTGKGAANTSTTDSIKQILTGKGAANAATTDTIKQVLTGKGASNSTTTDTVKEMLDPKSRADVMVASSAIGDAAGGSFTSRFSSKATAMFGGIFGGGGGDKIKSGASKSGDDAGGGFIHDFSVRVLGGIGPVILGMSAKVTTLVPLIGLALSALPAAMGAIGGLMGVAMIGGLLAQVVKGSPALKAQLTGLGTDFKSLMTQIAKPVLPALTAAFATLPGLIKSLTGPLTGIMKTVAPQIKGIFDAIGPVVRSLIAVMQAAAPIFGPVIIGVIKTISALLNGIVPGVKAFVPVVGQFVGILVGLGRNLGSLFSAATPAIRASMTMLGDLLGVVGGLLPILAKLGGVFATMLAPVFAQLGAVIKSLMPFLITIGTLIAHLAQAILSDLVSALMAAAALLIAVTPSFNILAKALGQVFTVLENSGAFAVLGDALEAIVPSLAKLINALVAQLAPILPIVIGLVSQLASIFITVLAAGLTTILTGLTKLVTTFPFLVPLIAGAAAAWWLLNLAMDANPIGAVIVGIVLLVGAITLLVQHWSSVWGTIKSVAQDAWNFVWNGFGKYLLPLLGPAGLIALGVTELYQHWNQIWGEIQAVAQAFWNWLSGTFGTDLANFFTKTIPGWWTTTANDATSIFVTPVKNTVNGLLSWLTGTFGPAIDRFFTVTIPGWWTDAYNAIAAEGNTMITWFKGLPGRIVSALGNLASLLVSGGKNLLSGMLTGIENEWTTVESWFKGMPSAILKALGIASPPPWSIEAGQHVMAGLLKGLTHGASSVEGFFKNLASSLTGPLKSVWAGIKSVGSGIASLLGFSSASGGSDSANQALGKQMAAAVGWTGAQWDAFNAVVMDESGWSSTITNPTSTAAGIAQNIAGFGPGYESGNAAQQIAWMISYIQGRYGTPEGALAHENADHWYGSGGPINEPVIGFGTQTGSRYHFGERGPEYVMPGSGSDMAGHLAAIRQLLARLIDTTAAIPGGVGQTVGGALGGAAQAASFRNRYPIGGA
jgi:phage-related protein